MSWRNGDTLLPLPVGACCKVFQPAGPGDCNARVLSTPKPLESAQDSATRTGAARALILD